jgi:predicted lysophospholipase L1 biosynthesis ABC-type transport system permease subunit
MTTNWMEQNRELFRALKLEQVVTFIVIALIVIVAALNILIALTMMVMEKTRDIAVMMSFGVEPGQVRRIFLLQGLLISLIGTALGLVLGYLAAWAGGHYHFIHLSAEVYSIDTLPFAPRPIDGVIVAAVSIGISLLATLYRLLRRRTAVEQGKRIHVYADETRPFLQGARLTAWELMADGIPTTVICDNMAASLMRAGKIQAVVVGADRIAANGDVANKIGTYNVAILAKEHGIPFYVAAPWSTIDLATPTGDAIPIESARKIEVTHHGGKQLTPTA